MIQPFIIHMQCKLSGFALRPALCCILLILLIHRPSSGALGFGPPRPLNPDATTDGPQDHQGYSRFVSNGQGWIVGISGGPRVHPYWSETAGASWSASSIPEPCVVGALFTALSLGNDGHIIAVWDAPCETTEREIVYSHSWDWGRAWSSPLVLNNNLPVDMGDDSFVDLATDGSGVWIAVWNVNTYDIYLSRSSDDGITWGAPIPVNKRLPNDFTINVLPRIETDRAGTWVIAWINYPRGLGSYAPTVVLSSRSLDNGVGWSPTVHISSPDNGVANGGVPGGWPTLRSDGQGNWLCAWASGPSEEDLSRDFDIVVSRSSDHGGNWSPAALVNTDAPFDGNRDDLVPSLATDAQGNWLMVWNTPCSGLPRPGTQPRCDQTEALLMAHSKDIGETWSNPVRAPAISATVSMVNNSPRVLHVGSGRWMLTWEMRPKSGIGPFGRDADIFYSITDNLDAHNGSELLVSFIPSAVPPGEAFQFGLAARNLGNTTWAHQQGYRLAITHDPQAALESGDPRVDLPPELAIQPGGQHQFIIPIVAPITPGLCILRFQMVQELVEFFGPEIELSFTVAPAPNSARDWTQFE
jgi:hypothetical protein